MLLDGQWHRLILWPVRLQEGLWSGLRWKIAKVPAMLLTHQAGECRPLVEQD